MIAKNYIKYPEALRVQCEMFSNGYHNSPRIMRLMEVVFSWTPTVPQWVKDAKAAASQLVKVWKKMQYELFGKFENVAHLDLAATIAKRSNNWTPTFTTNRADWSWAEDPTLEWLDGMAGVWVSYCDKHQPGKRGFAGQKQCVKGYGFSA
ncbi:MAG: hypothetical protein Q7U16_20380 [Agitococcus sp.]|nr:hypothetical protein [Agitococcus sp.]